MTKLADIFAQDEAIETLRRAWKSERLPHGMIFAGPAGVGKATTACALGALVLCEKSKGDDACGKCESCTLMGAGNHPDYHSVYRQLIRLEKESSKARDLPIDVIRQYVVGPAGLKAAMGRGKVFVVEEADLMNAAAQNALLKTLEEPPGPTLVILLTDSPNSLLPTIRSRAQIVRFHALDEKIVQRELEKRGIGKGPAAEAAGLAEGSLGVALRWIEDGVVVQAKELIRQIDALLAGKEPGDLQDWFKKAAEAYAARQLERDDKASKDQATKEGLALLLKIAANRFRRRLAETEDQEEMEGACSAIDAILRAENYLDSNVNVSLVLQQLASSLSRQFVAA
jgi:DNA polymerase-3 subunit delta'